MFWHLGFEKKHDFYVEYRPVYDFANEFQGLQNVNLSQDQLANMQQQVKTQLLKQQALARQSGKIPPTKVSILVEIEIFQFCRIL